jgi:hypothetical protein
MTDLTVPLLLALLALFSMQSEGFTLQSRAHPKNLYHIHQRHERVSLVLQSTLKPRTVTAQTDNDHKGKEMKLGVLFLNLGGPQTMDVS